MFNDFLFSLGNFGKIRLDYGVFDLFGPLTNVSKFCIRKRSNFDPSFGKTNRIRSSATSLSLQRSVNGRHQSRSQGLSSYAPGASDERPWERGWEDI